MAELTFPELRRSLLQRDTVRGVLVTWLCPDGSEVRLGERLAEVRTDDAERSHGWVCALAAGTLRHQAKPGEVLSVGSVIGLIE